MKAIPIEKSNRHLLCDDEDYELLASYRWHIVRNGSGGRSQLRAWSKERGSRVTPMGILFDLHSRAGYTFHFRDNNFCNYHRHNLQWRFGVEAKLISSLLVSHCPLGPALLRPKQTDGRSECCFICMNDDYDSYYICLDMVSHKTYWKGWIRHDA